MSARSRPFASIVIGVALAAPITVGCDSRARSEAETEPADDGRATQRLRLVARDRQRGVSNFWWQHLGAHGIAAAWVGPITSDAHGDHIRIVNLLYHLPGNQQPVAAVSRAVGIDDDTTLALSSKQHEFAIRPAGGLTWGSVRSAQFLQSELTGFDPE